MPPRSPLPWDDGQDPLLAELHHLGDPVADAAIAAHDGLAGLRVGEGEGWIAEHFGEHRPVWPDWVDEDLLALGQAFYLRQPWTMNVAFMLSSLPMSYCGRRGAEVLARTGTMADDGQRRVFETALLVMELAEPGGLGDGRAGRPVGDGYLTVLRLRLLHAAVRRTLVVHGYDARLDDGTVNRWDPTTLGQPVSQLDLLGTLWSFALSSVDALRLAGRNVTDELDGWVHLWCLVGHLLGVTDESSAGPLLPMAPEEAERCYLAIQRRQFGPSDEGAALATRLIEIGHERIPFERHDHLVEALVCRNLGPERAAMLGIEPVVDDDVLARAEWFWHLATDESAPGDDEERERSGRDKVAKYLLWRLARHLADEPEGRRLRSDDARRRLLDRYGVGDLVDLPERWDDVIVDDDR
jgi:hypothetical protein